MDDLMALVHDYFNGGKVEEEKKQQNKNEYEDEEVNDNDEQYVEYKNESFGEEDFYADNFSSLRYLFYIYLFIFSF